jgi:hypothetical protein
VISTKRKDALPRTGSLSAGRRKAVALPPIDALTEPLATEAPARKKKAHSLHQKERAASRKKVTRVASRVSAKEEKLNVLDELDAMEIAQALAALEPVADTVAVVEAPATAYEEVAVTAVGAPEVAALGPVESELDIEAFALVDAVDAVEPPATAYEELTVTAREATEVEALAVLETKLEAEASAIVEDLSVEAMKAQRIAIGPPHIPEETRSPSPARATAGSPAPAAPAPHNERRFPMSAISRLLSTLSRWTGVSGTK